jgi:anaerobic selenocysteine-containing dehydrogenase
MSDEHHDQNVQPVKNQHARIEKYTQPAAGWGALLSVARNLNQQGIIKKGAITLLNINQPTGFDCPGCAWPENKHKHTFNFCENGAKAIAFEATSKRVSREFFAEHSVSWLLQQSDYFLEQQGRLTDPLRYDSVLLRIIYMP